MITITFLLPAFWEFALKDNNYYAFSKEETTQIKKWIEKYNPGKCVSVSKKTTYGSYDGINCQKAIYTFNK